jgi:hypothetical protein
MIETYLLRYRKLVLRGANCCAQRDKAGTCNLRLQLPTDRNLHDSKARLHSYNWAVKATILISKYRTLHKRIIITRHRFHNSADAISWMKACLNAKIRVSHKQYTPYLGRCLSPQQKTMLTSTNLSDLVGHTKSE